jgi:hypothetical protein
MVDRVTGVLGRHQDGGDGGDVDGVGSAHWQVKVNTVAVPPLILGVGGVAHAPSAGVTRFARQPPPPDTNPNTPIF